jgi:ABC-2 type transport system ATP-binding protein
LLILDEPTAGVDIEIRHEMWDYLKELNTNGLSILLTTHYLEEAEQLCRYTTIIDQGKLLVTDETQKLLQQMDQESYSLGLHKPLLSPLPKAPFPCRQVNDNNIEIDLTKQHSLNDAFAFLSQHNITVNHIQNKSNRLETLFLNQLKKKS